MKPNQIYTSASKPDDIWSIANNRAMDDEFPYGFDESKNTRIKVLQHYYWCEDGRRVVAVYSAWFDDHSVVIFRGAGREGHDAYDRYITDSTLYGEMVAYWRTLIPGDDVEHVDPEEDIPALDFIYGQDMRAALNIQVAK